MAFFDEPLACTIEYWESINNEKFAETLYNDTIIAREALKQVEGRVK